MVQRVYAHSMYVSTGQGQCLRLLSWLCAAWLQQSCLQCVGFGLEFEVL
jgi:hypothetical protein